MMAIDTMRTVRDQVGDQLRRQAAGYARPDRATGGYAAAMGVFGAVAGGLSLVAARTGRRPPPLTPWELTLLGLATHKIARIVAKDAVTSPVRAPFTRFEGPQGNAELAEEVRGSGTRKAVGELLTCPFCLGPWVATALTAGLTFAPAVTRPAMGVFSAVAVSDFLQLGYAAAQQGTEPPESRAS
jgi:uncharacterized protein DUF1360